MTHFFVRHAWQLTGTRFLFRIVRTWSSGECAPPDDVVVEGGVGVMLDTTAWSLRSTLGEIAARPNNIQSAALGIQGLGDERSATGTRFRWLFSK